MKEEAMEMYAGQHAGFWIRLFAYVIDSVFLGILAAIFVSLIDRFAPEASVVFFPTYYLIYSIIIISFWVHRGATPGKILMHIKIVDAETGGKPRLGQCIGRYAGYIVSALILFLGFLWVVFDARKQGWHDKLSGTLVIRV